MVYALSFFLFLSGVWRGHPRLMALSLIVVFLYGSLIWGLFPIEPHMSYEGHLTGALAGGVIAWFYRKKGPQKTVVEWKEEEDSEEEEDTFHDDDPPTPPPAPSQMKIVYTIVEGKKGEG
jgi:hypothetical protein